MASKRRLRRKKCTSKNAYATYEDAFYSAKRSTRRDGNHISPYKCPWGNHWHIGHTPAATKSERFAA